MCVCACVRACVRVCVYACIYIYICMYVCMYVCMYACMHVCICVHVYIYKIMYMHTWYIHSCVVLRCGCRTAPRNKAIVPPQISRMEAANSQTLSATGKASQHHVRLVCPCLGKYYVGDLVICVIHCKPCVYAYQAMFQHSNPASVSYSSCAEFCQCV